MFQLTPSARRPLLPRPLVLVGAGSQELASVEQIARHLEVALALVLHGLLRNKEK